MRARKMNDMSELPSGKELRGSVDEAISEALKWFNEADIKEPVAEIAALRAEVERLRGALSEIADCERYTRLGGATAQDLGDYEDGLNEAIDVSIAAIAPPLTE